MKLQLAVLLILGTLAFFTACTSDYVENVQNPQPAQSEAQDAINNAASLLEPYDGANKQVPREWQISDEALEQMSEEEKSELRAFFDRVAASAAVEVRATCRRTQRTRTTGFD